MKENLILMGNFIGAMTQVLYLCLFFTNIKRVKYNRVKLYLLSLFDYLIIQNFVKFNISINADLLYVIIFYSNLKILYKDKIKVTDIITYILAFILLGLTSMLCLIIFRVSLLAIFISFLILSIIIYLTKNKLYKIDDFYNKFWNRHSNPKMLKSVTIRGLSASFTMIVFSILHLWLLYGIIIIARR